MTDNTQPEALDLADWLEAVGGGPSAKRCAALMREQYAHIIDLEAQLAAIGAGGVSGPLLGGAALAAPQQAAPAAEWLEQAYREGWAACRDAETIGQEAEDWAFGNSTANSRMIDMQQAAPQPEAWAVPDLEKVLRELDTASDFIDCLLDEVLGLDRPEWSSTYGRDAALNEVQERMTALHKPTVDKTWDQFQSAMSSPQEEVQEPTRTSGRNCYLCGHPEDAHPMEPDPRGGMRRGSCPMTAAWSAPSGDARAAFEAWAHRQSWIKDCGKSADGDAYGHWDTQKAWLAWDAAHKEGK